MKPSSMTLAGTPGARQLGMAAPARRSEPASIVDQLIAERAPGLNANRAGRWLLERVLHPMLDYGRAVELAQRIAPLGGRDVFDLIRAELDQRLIVSGLEHVPQTGRVIVFANHPTGLADGIAVWTALQRVRPDLWFLANADALRVAKGLAEIVVPVEWVQDKRSHTRTKEMLHGTSRVMREESALVIFPSGRLSHFSWRGLAERPWQPTVVALARRYRAPILPMRLIGRNSALFHLFARISSELRDITLFHELLNKRGRPFEVQIAAPLRVEDLPPDPAAAVRRLQRYVEKGLRDRAALTRPWHPVGRPALALAR